MNFQSPPDNPITAFAEWLSEAEKTELNDPNAMSVATVDSFGMPNVRVVLLKGCLLYTSPSPRDRTRSRMPSSA